MYGTNPTDQLYLAVLAKQIGEGLEQRIEGFVREHPGTHLFLLLINTHLHITTQKQSRPRDAKRDFSSCEGFCFLLLPVLCLHLRRDRPFEGVPQNHP